MTAYDCASDFANLASGAVAYSVGSVAYPLVLAGLAFLMGLGKGGVPGSSTTSVALNSLFAPDGFGCLDASVALGVPITFLADVTVVVNYLHLARWDIIVKLLPPTGVGVAIGTQLMGRLDPPQAKLLIGCILLGILSINLAQAFLVPAPKGKGKGGAAGVPAYATSLWFATVVGVIGGFATILTNSMGPMLNVYLLTLQLEPTTFVGTRATFFTMINTLKMAQRLYTGSLSMPMLKLGSGFGLIAIAGVFASTAIIPRMSKDLFMKLEYGLMTFAGLKLIDAGLGWGYLG